MRNRSVISALALVPAVGLYASEPADSLSRALDEVTVEAARQTITPEVEVFIPENKQKQASPDAVALLRRMGIPQLNVDELGGTVKTISGESVSLFIDYLPATANDIKGMRMKDVVKVEVYDSPTDARFRGVEHVVNFIMQKYEYGGYAKIYNQMYGQRHDFVERPTLTGKAAYKRMTYDAVVGGDYVDGHSLKSSETASFKFPGLDEITRSITPGKAGRLAYHTVFGTLRATYQSEKAAIANSVGYNYSKQPHFDDYGRLTFTGVDLPGSEMANIVNRLWRTAEWSGDYYFALPRDFTLSLNPQAQYSYTVRDAEYVVDATPSISNKADSKTVYTRLDSRLNKKLNDRVTLFAEVSGSYNRNSVEYTGSNPGKVTLDRYYFGPEIGVAFRTDKFRLNGDAGYAFEWNDTGNNDARVFYPFMHLSTNYAFSDKLSLRTWTQFASSSPDAAERSPIMQQQNEFLWNSGNPDIGNSHHVTQQVSLSWFPSNRFQLSGYMAYFHLFDNLRRTYTPQVSADGVPMMVSHLYNDGAYNRYSAGVSMTLKLLDNNLQLRGGGDFSYYYLTGGGNDISKPYANWYVMGNYYLKDFNFTAYYYSHNSAVSSQSGSVDWSNESYAIAAGWGKNELSLNLYLTNFLAKDETYSRSTLHTPYYSSVKTLANGNHTPTVYLTVTYTFGFGKKIERGNEVKAVSATSDGILK